VLAKYQKSDLFSTASCLDAAPVAAAFFLAPVGAAPARSGRLSAPSIIRVGLLDCYDIEFAASVTAALQQGVDALALPMSWENTVPVSSAVALQQVCGGVGSPAGCPCFYCGHGHPAV
jgi:predicted amidohydrolase